MFTERIDRLSFLLGTAVGLVVTALLAWRMREWPIESVLAYVAIIVAAMAALASVLSLKWARDTIRPFLFATGKYKTLDVTPEKVPISFTLRNSGTLPGTISKWEVAVFEANEKVTESNVGKTYRFRTEMGHGRIIFPNQEYEMEVPFDLKKPADKAVWDDFYNGKLIFRIAVQYKSLGRTHKTGQSFYINEEMNSCPIEPQWWR